MTLLRSHCFLPSPQIQKGNFPYWLSVSQMPMTVHWHSEQWTQWTNQWRHRTYLTWMEKYFHCKYHHLLKKERKRNWLLKRSTIYKKTFIYPEFYSNTPALTNMHLWGYSCRVTINLPLSWVFVLSGNKGNREPFHKSSRGWEQSIEFEDSFLRVADDLFRSISILLTLLVELPSPLSRDACPEFLRTFDTLQWELESHPEPTCFLLSPTENDSWLSFSDCLTSGVLVACGNLLLGESPGEIFRGGVFPPDR